MFAIPASDVAKYEALFDQLEPVNNRLDGSKCRPVMLKSQLSNETLGRIWDLSDIDDDGCLDKSEFVLAMHLCHRCSEGDMLPDTLPPNLIPPGKESFFSPTSSLPDVDVFVRVGNLPSLPPVITHTKSPWSEMSLVPVSAQPTSPVAFNRVTMPTAFFNFPPWAISEEELVKSNRIFTTIDSDVDGLVTGPEVREVLLRSGLPQPILAQIWNLIDPQGIGMLNCEQFAVAMHLVTDQLSSSPYSRTLPAVLPPALVPPSLRPVAPDPSVFEESNKLIAEIEAINRERADVENSYSVLSIETQRRATEAAAIQRRLDTLGHTCRSLMNQRTEAERRLSDYSHERDTLETMLKELKGHISDERKRVEEFRNPLNNQQEAAKKEAIDRLRTELSGLIREVTVLQDRVAEKRRRLQQIETENLATQERVEKTSDRLQTLQSVRGQLLQVLDQYNGVLNGSAELDESRVKALLDAQEVGVRSPDSRLTRPVTNQVNNFDWSAGNGGLSRVVGSSSSVPLSTVHSTRLDGANNDVIDRQHTVSSIGSPITFDPFQGIDPFASDPIAKQEKNSKGDPFAPASLFPASDPFDGVDPFGSDPFSVVQNNSFTYPSNEGSPFDPFTSQTNQSPAATTVFADADFDAAFGPKSAEVRKTDDPFAGDPFTGMERKALTNDSSSAARRSPPPRPTLQPGAGRLARKSSSVSANRMSRLTSARSIGSLPSVSRSISCNTTSGFNTVSSGSNKLGVMSKVRSSKTKAKSNDRSSAWTPTGLTEAEQLSLATLESERLARLDEQARQQEEAELQLAIQLSQMDTRSA